VRGDTQLNKGGGYVGRESRRVHRKVMPPEDNTASALKVSSSSSGSRVLYTVRNDSKVKTASCLL
jgi:hypothetical protein